MKTILLFGFSLFFCVQSFSQVIWTGGGGTVDWNDPNNWSSNAVPGSMDNVEIPAGFTVTIGNSATCQSLELEGDAILNIDSSGGLNSSQPSLFEPGTTVNWAQGTIDCSLLVNQGTMNLTSSADKLFEQSTLVNNNGTINIIGSGDLFLREGTVLNNEANGTIDMRADDGDIDNLGGLPILNNEGIILRSTSAGEAQITAVELNNNGGTIQVNSGTLRINGFGEKNFTGGNYVVSSGTVMDWDAEITLSGFLDGTLEGAINWNNTVHVPESATLNFTGAGNFNWNSGNLNGGGVLTNQSALYLTGTFGKSIQENTTFNNSGTINITDTGNLIIQGGSVLNNQSDGIIDMQADTGNIIASGGGSGILNNTGLIKRTTSIGIAEMAIKLNNNGGIIQVENGTLSFTSISGGLVKNLTDGTYNISSGAVLDWEGSIVLSGVLSGQIDGALNWDNVSNNTVSVPESATLNFTGSGNVNWVDGTLNGGGVLTNQSTLDLTTNGSKSIIENTTLNNEGIINVASGGDLFITQGILNNQASGVLDLQADEGNITQSGGTSSVLNNMGLLKRTSTTEIARIFVELNNSGTIEVETGELLIANAQPFTNEENGIVKGVGVFTLPDVANYTNNGVFAPGSSPGTLTVQGDFKSSSDAVLGIELNGLTQDSEYDLLAIIGEADFEGDIQIILGFDPIVDDEFVIATATSSINTCNLPSSVLSSFGGNNYGFEVVCNNDNELIVTVTDITVGIDSFDENESGVKLYPNPATDVISFTDESINTIRIYSLDGKLVKTINSYSGSISDLDPGAYLVKGITEKGASVAIQLIKH